MLDEIMKKKEVITGKDRHGLWVVVDGMDGVGKGVVERVILAIEQKQHRAVFDTIAYSWACGSLPELKDFWNPPRVHFNTIVTAEPTYVWGGAAIREEIIARNSRDYSAEVQAEEYSNDRLVLMKRVNIPALKAGLRVVQSRCFASTKCYQVLLARLQGGDVEKINQKIMSHPGTQIELEYRPDLLIIPTLSDASEVMRRMHERKEEKDDEAIFETVEFQSGLREMYESPELRNLFEERGTCVCYLDTGISEQSTREQTREIYTSFLETGTVPEKYRTPEICRNIGLMESFR
jgi:thymidylate kinase